MTKLSDTALAILMAAAQCDDRIAEVPARQSSGVMTSSITKAADIAPRASPPAVPIATANSPASRNVALPSRAGPQT